MSRFVFDGPCTPGDEEWHRRMDLFMSDPTPWTWWWLSFVDPERPAGQRLLGVAIVPAANAVMASVGAHALGCNPGGEMAAWPLEIPDGTRPKPEYVGRLIPGELGRSLSEAGVESYTEPDA